MSTAAQGYQIKAGLDPGKLTLQLSLHSHFSEHNAVVIKPGSQITYDAIGPLSLFV